MLFSVSLYVAVDIFSSKTEWGIEDESLGLGIINQEKEHKKFRRVQKTSRLMGEKKEKSASF